MDILLNVMFVHCIDGIDEQGMVNRLEALVRHMHIKGWVTDPTETQRLPYH